MKTKNIVPKQFISLAKEALEKLHKKEKNDDSLLAEKEFQLAITNELLDHNHKAFMEYPFEGSNDNCDIVITPNEDPDNPLVWIEIKPIWPYGHSNYWSPSKFCGKHSPFQHDIQKLSNINTGKGWFLLLIYTSEKIITEDASEPTQQQRLSEGQILEKISNWSKSRPTAQRAFKADDTYYCHLILWGDMKEVTAG